MCLRISSSRLSFLVLPKLAEGVGVASSDDKRPGDGVSNGDGDEVLEDDVGEADGRLAGEHAHWQEEHVGDGVLQPNGDEGGDGEPGGDSGERGRLKLKSLCRGG